MNLFPINKQNRRPWIVRCLRTYGYFITIIAMLAGFFFGSRTVAQIVLQATGWPKLLAVSLSTVICGILGFGVGLFSSLPFWAFAMALDDLHAMRQYSQGYVITGTKDDLPSA